MTSDPRPAVARSDPRRGRRSRARGGLGRPHAAGGGAPCARQRRPPARHRTRSPAGRADPAGSRGASAARSGTLDQGDRPGAGRSRPRPSTTRPRASTARSGRSPARPPRSTPWSTESSRHRESALWLAGRLRPYALPIGNRLETRTFQPQPGRERCWSMSDSWRRMRHAGSVTARRSSSRADVHLSRARRPDRLRRRGPAGRRSRQGRRGVALRLELLGVGSELPRGPAARGGHQPRQHDADPARARVCHQRLRR